MGATETFVFTVDASTMATLGSITLDGTIDVTDQSTAQMSSDNDATLVDTWDVIGAVAAVRTVDAVDAQVAQGGTGYPVSVTVENTGLAGYSISTATLSFTGTADRTSEYTVMPDPGNPMNIAAGATETLNFTADVALMATIEGITIDAGVTGMTTVSAAPVDDADADVTDMWIVVTCNAPNCGDCNGDTMLTILDALLAAQHSAGLTTLMGTAFSNCNVIGALEPDPGATVTILDALTLAQAAAGLPVTLTCC
jgi:hypothetical protein